MNTLTHFEYAPASASLRDGLRLPLKWVAALSEAFRQWHRRGQLINELSGLDDRELTEIGLQRGDIPMLAAGHPVPALDRWFVRR